MLICERPCHLACQCRSRAACLICGAVQVFVKGEFIGGCDILMSMHENGELEKLFGEDLAKRS
jgi:hypothetical protein